MFQFSHAQPENIELVVRKAIEIHTGLESDNIRIKGAAGAYNRKQGWNTNPKLTVEEIGHGKNNYNLEKPQTPTQSKFLVAVLYALCSINNCVDKAHLFYNDRHGKSRSIATKHGPEHSDYMQQLIAKLSDVDFVEKVKEEYGFHYPKDLTEVERSILDSVTKNELSLEDTEHLLKTHKIKAHQLLATIEKLSRRDDLSSKFLPTMIHWPTITLLEYEDRLTNAVEQKTSALKTEVSILKKEKLKLSKNLKSMQKEHESLKNLSFFQRIFNWKNNINEKK